MDKRIGNEFWKKRASHGRAKLFESSQLLWEACHEYFAWVEANPLIEAKLVSFQGKSKLENVPHMRAMTLGGLCTFLDIDRSTWTTWRASDKDFSTICKAVDEIIREQKFNGAAAGMLNPVIIARDIGLTEKVDNVSSDGSMTPITKIERHVIYPKDRNA